MEMDYSLKKLANFFKFLLSILETLLKTDYSLFYLGEVISYFPTSAVTAISSSKRGLKGYSRPQNNFRLNVSIWTII